LVFFVTARQANRGYYLHAGVEERYRHLGTADLLADYSIHWAISKGCRSFSMMAWPLEQPGLHKFKQKWTEEDSQWTVIQMTQGVLGRLTEFMLLLI
jgi:lipid II:glycine glycyltransferase (peptidoglycan interpeptide bridge formation enzyme)